MSWSPSVLREVEEKASEDQIEKKRFHLIPYREQKGSLRNPNNPTEIIYAGFPKERKNFSIRPVMLVLSYMEDLFFQEEELPKGKEIIKVDERTFPTYNEINSAIKESMRVEKDLISKLEKNEPPKRSEKILSSEKDFFISKNRLLGEILRSQRKIEKIRIEGGPLSIQIALERFIRKLCILKVQADKTEEEK